MTWFKIDDSFWSHPKTLAVSSDAIALWVRAGSYSCQHLTDGRIKRAALPLFGLPDSAVEELLEVVLWEVDGDDLVFHDWADYQETSEAVKERRQRARDRMRVVRANKERTAHERALEQSAKFAESSLNPDPTRPDPTRPVEPNGSTRETPRTRGTRIPEPFIVNGEMRSWAAEEVPDLDVDRSTRAFVDYWRAKAGKEATKVDWVATWRNWLRRDDTNGGPPARPGRAPSAFQQAASIVEMFEEVTGDAEGGDRKALGSGGGR